MVWLDGLDIPMLRFFGATFAESYGEPVQPLRRGEGDSLARYGSNMLPLRHQPTTPTSPLFSYPYARSREALERLARLERPDPWEGHKLRYVNPATGGWAMPTIATCLQLLPADFLGQPARSTDASVYSVVEGSGVAQIGGRRFAFEARICSSCPPGPSCAWKPAPPTACCSVSPTALCSRRSASSANPANPSPTEGPVP